jgi:hypothetical protein
LSSCYFSKILRIKIYKNHNLPVILYGCEIWSLTLREEHRLRVFGNRLLRRIFGPKRKQVNSRLEKNCTMRRGACSMHDRTGNAYKI